MMKRMETPRPWYLEEDGCDIGRPYIRSANNMIVAKTYRAALDGGISGPGEIDGEGNAALIVRAVNAHDDLVAGLRTAVTLYETYGLLAQSAGCGAWVNAARAALAKAEAT